jgi:hypothetical protein
MTAAVFTFYRLPVQRPLVVTARGHLWYRLAGNPDAPQPQVPTFRLPAMCAGRTAAILIA